MLDQRRRQMFCVYWDQVFLDRQRPTPALLKCQCSGVVCEAFKMSSCHDEDQKDHQMSPKTRDVVGLMLARCRRRWTNTKATNTVLLSRVVVFFQGSA